MKIQFITEDDLIDLKSNLSSLVDNFSITDNTWLISYFGRSPFKDTKYEVDDFVLDMSQEKSPLTDAENAKRIYSHLKFLSDSQASEEKIWAALCLGKFWDYTQYRWGHKTIPNIEQHFFFAYGARRSLSRNAIARLWWIGRLTYDSNRSNPYELTDLVCGNSDFIMHVMERNTSNNPMIIRAFLTAILDSKRNGVLVNTDIIGDLSKYLNLLGGIYILDCVSYQFIYDKITKKMLEISKE